MSERKEHLFTFGKMPINTSIVEISLDISQNLKLELPYDPAIPPLGVHPENTIPYHRDTYSYVYFRPIHYSISRLMDNGDLVMHVKWKILFSSY